MTRDQEMRMLYNASYSYKKIFEDKVTVASELSGIDVHAEYELIKQKKSKLPARKRKLIQLNIQELIKI